MRSAPRVPLPNQASSLKGNRVTLRSRRSGCTPARKPPGPRDVEHQRQQPPLSRPDPTVTCHVCPPIVLDDSFTARRHQSPARQTPADRLRRREQHHRLIPSLGQSKTSANSATHARAGTRPPLTPPRLQHHRDITRRPPRGAEVGRAQRVWAFARASCWHAAARVLALPCAVRTHGGAPLGARARPPVLGGGEATGPYHQPHCGGASGKDGARIFDRSDAFGSQSRLRD